jgi:hypothetical protein
MICIACRNDCKYRERSDGKCPKCRHPFAFEPRTGARITDAGFEQALARVSAYGKIKWTKGHLHYELARRIDKKRITWPVFAFAVLVTGIGLAGRHHHPAFLVLGFALFVTGCALAISRRRPTLKLTPTDFEGMYRSWVRAHGEPAALIARRAPLPAAKAPRALPADIGEYSFDRAVVCDRRETVDLLLANNFHFENNCAVLSVDGYPEPAFATVLAMLKKNPKLVVYALHDASLDGCGLARRLATSPEWFAKGAHVIDVGLTPRHARAFRGLWTETGIWHANRGSTDDERWLARYSLELAVIRPEQVIKRLFRAISQTPEAFAEGLAIDAAAFSSDASASDGGGDSFG